MSTGRELLETAGRNVLHLRQIRYLAPEELVDVTVDELEKAARTLRAIQHSALEGARLLEKTARNRATEGHDVKTSLCRSCDAVIVWAVTSKDRLMPVDAAKDPNGNVELVEERHHVTAIVHAGPDLFSSDRHMPHHATCPQADQWRGGGTK